MAHDSLRRIRLNRQKKRTTLERAAALDAELPQLVRDAFKERRTWQQIAAELNVTKARVYQLRAHGASND